jgi:glycosyltransferase involved in cell wall biosynthesis
MRTSRAGTAAEPGARVRVLFLIPQLGAGGAERQMVLLARAFDKTRFDVTIAPMYAGGAWWNDARQIEGVSIRALDKRGRYDVLGFGQRLARVVREVRPHVVQTHGVSAPFGLAAATIGRCRLVLGIRNSNMEFAQYGWLELRMFSVGRYISRAADFLVANSNAGKAYYAAHGYPASKIRVIPNGFDTEEFKPCPSRGLALRHEWGIADDQLLVGIVARIDPAKDHEGFLRAAAIVARAEARARFAVIGHGSANDVQRLVAVAESLGIADRVVWPGHCPDMVAAHNALDLCVSTSRTEGISNSIGEAMACGVPCAVTDAGDSALLLGDRSRVSPPGQPCAAAETWLRVLALPSEARRALGAADRQRIESCYSLAAAAGQLELYLAETTDPLRRLA